MIVKVAYKNHGDLEVFKLTKDRFVGRTIPVSEQYCFREAKAEFLATC